MTINNIKFLLLFFSVLSYSQNKIIQDFNIDGIKDTLIYKCYPVQNTFGEPTCKLELTLGKIKKNYQFYLEYVSDAMVGSYGKGNIYLFDWSKDTEYTREYDYSKKYDDWILTRDEELLKYENDKEVNNLSKNYLLGISGKRYPLKRKIRK